MPLTKQQATELAQEFQIPLKQDFHTLPYSTVERVLEAADKIKWRQYHYATRSRGHGFYAYLNKAASRRS